MTKVELVYFDRGLIVKPLNDKSRIPLTTKVEVPPPPQRGVIHATWFPPQRGVIHTTWFHTDIKSARISRGRPDKVNPRG